jgi:myo-inositol 2-dehydrogenase/D-chiro-inositol 1-dehydrogenase
LPTARRARLAVVGLGRIGRLHAQNLATRVPGAELVAVADAHEPLAREVGCRHGVRWTGSMDDVLGDPGIDGVVIATPSAVHPALVKQAAEAGRHIFCEKPLGLDVEVCREAVAAAEAAGVALQVGFQRRFDRDWLALKNALEAGAIGSLALFRCSHRNAEPPADAAGLGDLFADVAVHDLDAARWLGGELAEIRAMAPADGAAAVLSLRFGSGALGVVDVHRHAVYGFECSAELVGSAGTIRCGHAHRRDGTELLRDGAMTAALVRDHAERHAAAYVAELEHFGEVACGRAQPVVGGSDALAALRLAELAARSAAQGASQSRATQRL